MSSECKPCLRGVFATFFAVKASCKQMLTCYLGLSLKDALLKCYPLEPSQKGPLLIVNVPGLLTMSTLAGSYFLDRVPTTSNSKWVGEPDYRFAVLSFLVFNRRQYLSGILCSKVKEQ